MNTCRSTGAFQGRHGFTLIEVILSIVILALGIISVQRVFLGSLSALNVIENWGQAQRLLDEKIWGLRREALERGRLSGAGNAGEMVLGSDRTFQYDVSIREKTPDARLREVHALISWRGVGRGHFLKRTFYLMEPYAEGKR